MTTSLYVFPVYLSWNKPTCYFMPCLVLYRATWWQIGLNSKEDICVTRSQSLVETGRAGSSQTPSTARRATLSSCGNKCAWRRRISAVQWEVQQEAVAQWHKEHSGCIVSIKGNYSIVSVALMSFDLGSLCWLTFSEESTELRENKPLS